MDRLKHATKLVREHYQHRVRGKRADDARVLLLEDARVIYVPIPKAANSSTKLALCPTLGLEPAEVAAEIHRDPRLPMHRFSTLAPRLGPDWFVFTIVRNPWTRALSAWRDKVVREGASLRAVQAMGIEAGDDFETFLAALSRFPRKMLNDHFIPQADLLAPVMATAPVEIVRSEDLPAAWEPVRARIAAQGATGPDAMGRLNANASGRAPPVYSPRARAMIRRLYAEDFRLLGYDCAAPPAG